LVKVNSNPSFKDRALTLEVLKHLPELQDSFVFLLADPKSKQLSRESCCLGLAACRGLSVAASLVDQAKTSSLDAPSQSHRLNERLLKAFGQTSNFGGSAMQETREQEAARRRQENSDSNNGVGAAAMMMEDFGIDTEVGGTSGMGEAALGAYREMAGAAMSLDRPDVLYSLMLLSVTHTVWYTAGVRDRYNATTLLGKESASGGVNTLEIKEALRPHLAKLIPRLLRACNDPNKQTREQMSALWTGITGGGAEARAVITQHLLTTIDILIQDGTSKLWRARVGACGALADVIVGRSWTELGGGGAVIDDDEIVVEGKSTPAGVRLLQLWRVTTRALDDVRSAVRESGEALARSIRSLTIRLCDPSTTDESGRDIYRSSASRLLLEKESEADAALAAGTALRWLVKHGLNQPCAEATGCCVSCLLGIVDVARPSTLQPVLSELIGSLIMAMSGLEPSALNYLQVRAAGNDPNGLGVDGSYDRLERLRLQMAQTGPIAGALTKCLEMMRFMSLDSQKEVIPHIDSALRCGAGFATRAAAADAVSTLCNTCPSAFKFTGSSSTNSTVRLLRALYFASERERGSAARDKMTHALGSLAELAPGSSVRVLAVRACEKYSASMGSNDDPAARKAAAGCLRSIAVRSSSQFSEGGSSDIWCRRVLPIAFLGQKDEDSKVASLWKDVWEEGGAAANISGRENKSFGVLLQERLLPYLVSECIDALNDVSWSRRVAACAALIDLTNMDVLAPAPRPLQSNGTDMEKDKDFLLRSRRRAHASNLLLSTCVKLIVKSRVWTGKAELVKASVNIAGKWAALGYLDDGSNWALLGWDQKEGKESTCSWVPIMNKVGNWNDLISGDNWFEARDKKAKDMDMNDDVTMESVPAARSVEGEEEEDEPDDTKLNFDDEDKISEDEGAPVISELIHVNEAESLFEGTVTFSGFCRALLEQTIPNAKSSSLSSIDDALPYRAASLQGLSDLLRSLVVYPTEEVDYDNDHRLMYQKYLYTKLAPSLIDLITGDGSDSSAISLRSKQPPLIVARSIDCLASAMWVGIGEPCKETGRVDEYENVVQLSKIFFISCGGKQPAWTVREASALAAACLASKASLVPLRKHETLTALLDCTMHTSKDRKFWRVRYAGLKLLHTLVSRVGSANQHSSVAAVPSNNKCTSNAQADRQLMLEALLPHKEKIIKLARASLSDNEAKVTAVATDICGTVAWWP